MVLVSSLTEEQRTYLKETFQDPLGILPQEGSCTETQQRLPQGFDAHFHLDRLLQKSRLNSLQAVMTATASASRPFDLVGCCTSFCDEERWPSNRQLDDLPTEVLVAIGVHPRHAKGGGIDGRSLRRLENLICHRRVVALGEVGIDHTESPHRWHHQLELLERVLPLAKPQLVVVFHCRGMKGDDGEEAYCLLLSWARRLLPREQRIYLHCFEGTSHILKKWLAAFPMLFCGFTSLARSFGEERVAALRSVPEDRILLETDAPYFAGGSGFSSPTYLSSTAEVVASHLGKTWEQVLSLSTRNARKLFGLGNH